MGDKLRTMLNLEVVKSDLENNYYILKAPYLAQKIQLYYLEVS